MILGLKVLAAGLLALIAWQDWQARSVSWPAFPLLTACLLAGRLVGEPVGVVGIQVAFNVGLLAVLLATLALYVRLRFGPGTQLRHCLGSGDVLLWLALATYLGPAGLLLFILLTSLASLLLVGLGAIRRLPGQAVLTIPLAGLQATGLLGLLAGEWLLPPSLSTTLFSAFDPAWMLTIW